MKTWIAASASFACLVLIASACHGVRGTPRAAEDELGAASIGVAGSLGPNHGMKVMESKFCAKCHPAIYAEHEENTHGRAFTDEEVRVATGNFDHGDCIRCHTPRPIFETGIGQNPIRRYHNLEEGNTCMTCHWQANYDYGQFAGGIECVTAFEDRVGEVEACASCHRNHGTPYQWEIAPTGKRAGKTCMTCHMPLVRRPVAVGQRAKMVRSHVFPGARSESQLRRAYSYEAELAGNEVVVTVTNDGAGHHFPTELKQRSVESLVIVSDAEGNEVSRSRMVFRDPYKRPYGLTLPVNTQIPPGQSRQHRVPVKVASGSVRTELHYKYYFPIEDHHPELARQLEERRIEFEGVMPSDKEVVSQPGSLPAHELTPEGISAREAGFATLVDVVNPPIGDVEIALPEGDSEAVIERLIQFFQFPVPEGNRLAQSRLVEIGAPAVPQLVDALGSWDNKTFKQSASVLARIGRPAVAAILAALDHEDLYVRFNARAIVAKVDPGSFRDLDEQDEGMRARVVESLIEGCDSSNALDRRSSLETATQLGLEELHSTAMDRLGDTDPDVVVAAADLLAVCTTFGEEQPAIEAIEAQLQGAHFPETKRALAVSLAELGSPAGVLTLLGGLDIHDNLIREDYFESLFRVTGRHFGYDPGAPRPDRLAGIARLQSWWAELGGADVLRRIDRVPGDLDARAWKLLAGFADDRGDDNESQRQLVELGSLAVPALVRGLKYPYGFAARRQWICSTLRSIGSLEAAPALVATLKDPVLQTAHWACLALQNCGDAAVLPALVRYRDRLKTLRARDAIPSVLDFGELLEAVERGIERFE